MRREDVDTAVEIVDDRVTMTARDDADLYVSVPGHTPLSAAETHAALRVEGDGFSAMVDLDAADCDALAAALEAAPEEADE